MDLLVGLLWHILLGAVIGIIARLIHPGRERMGCLMTILIGAAGSFLAGLIGDFLGWWDTPSWIGLIVAVVVAVILVTVYAGIKGKR